MKELVDFYDLADISSDFLSSAYGIESSYFEDLVPLEIILRTAYNRGLLDGFCKGVDDKLS